MKPTYINGRYYPMWQQFVDKKAQFIGQTLVDLGDPIDRAVGGEPMRTRIEDVTLTANGYTSAMFTIHGEDFNCGFDVRHGGISGLDIPTASIVFSGVLNQVFYIEKADHERT